MKRNGSKKDITPKSSKANRANITRACTNARSIRKDGACTESEAVDFESEGCSEAIDNWIEKRKKILEDLGL